MSHRSFLFTLVFLGSFFYGSSQRWPDNSEVAASLHYGSFITASAKADFVKDSYSSFGEISFSKPVLAFPAPRNAYPLQWGGGIFFGNSGSRKYIGNFGGAYGFLDFGLAGAGNFEIRMRTGLGIGLVEKPYDVETNHKNLLIGSKANLFIHAALKAKYRISDKWNVHSGLSFSHLSNATSKLPNLGLNIPSVFAGVSTFIRPKPIIHLSKERSGKNVQLLLQATAGVKESPWVHSRLYGQLILGAEAGFREGQAGRFISGINLLYDDAQDNLFIDSIITVGMRNYSSFNMAPFAGYEVVVGKISFPVTVGFYLFDSKKKFYQNYGIRFRWNEHMSAGGFLKAHGGTADFVHAGLAWHFK